MCVCVCARVEFRYSVRILTLWNHLLLSSAEHLNTKLHRLFKKRFTWFRFFMQKMHLLLRIGDKHFPQQMEPPQ